MKPADYTVKYLAHRNVFVGYMFGRIVVTKKTEGDVTAWFRSHQNSVKPVATQTKVNRGFSAVRTALTQQTAEVVEKAKRVFGARLASFNVPTVEFFSRGATAGKAYYNEHKVTYNEAIAEHNGFAAFTNTVIHEVSHLIVRQLYPFAKAHGQEFKTVMRALGGTGERCHNYDVSTVVSRHPRNYVWKCACKEHKVTGRKHTNMMAHPGAYKCKHCGVAVKFVGLDK